MNIFQRDLKWAMQKTLIENIENNGILAENDITIQKKYIKTEVTYEQLLNMCFNNNVDNVYLESDVLEYSAINIIAPYMMQEGWSQSDQEIETAKIQSGFEKSKKNKAAAKVTSAKVAAIKKTRRNEFRKSQLDAQDNKNVLRGDPLSKIENMAKDAADYFKSDAGKSTMKKGGLAIMGAVALGVAANFVYKRFLSKSAKSCKGKSGNDFKQCVAKFKNSAIKHTLSKLKGEKSKCKDEKCSTKLDKQISKWQGKLL